MNDQRPTLADLDTWRGERKLDCSKAPARHAVAAWALVAAMALAAVLGPPAGRETVAGLAALRHDVLMLDRELERAALRSRLAADSSSRLQSPRPSGSDGMRARSFEIV
jgi:hypothetical protein